MSDYATSILEIRFLLLKPGHVFAPAILCKPGEEIERPICCLDHRYMHSQTRHVYLPRREAAITETQSGPSRRSIWADTMIQLRVTDRGVAVNEPIFILKNWNDLTAGVTAEGKRPAHRQASVEMQTQEENAITKAMDRLYHDANHMVDISNEKLNRERHANPRETEASTADHNAITLWDGTILTKWFMDEKKIFNYLGPVEA